MVSIDFFLLLLLGPNYYPIFMISMAIISFSGGILGFNFYYKNQSSLTKKVEQAKKDKELQIIIHEFHLLLIGHLILIIVSILFCYYSLDAISNYKEPSSARFVYNIMPAILYLIVSFIIGVEFVGLGFNHLVENYKSIITRLFFLAFLFFGIAYFIFFYYNLSAWTNPELVNFIYLIFFVFNYTALIILAHACQALIVPNKPYFKLSVYLTMGITFLITFFLLLNQITHIPWFKSDTEGSSFIYLLKARRFTDVLSAIYTITILFPIGYSLYRLSNYPEWISLERSIWIKRIRIGIILLIAYPIGEPLAGLSIFKFIRTPFISSNPIPPLIFIYLIMLFILTFSSLIIYSGIPSINKWFFDEIKFRSSTELKELNPDINLTNIWETVDNWEKEKEITTNEMTNQKLSEYIQAVKEILLEEKSIN
ncbi:MAG: hypothetical protein ACXAC7_14560 [Candidatus Hodarchaeales archaeon]